MAFTTYENAPYLYRMSGGQTVATFDFYVEVFKSA